ncbi:MULTISPECIES: hypothetical protein [unclassified Methylobacterium]|jgi:hypothetical protein|nr:hypothetical protein [Methylobacterium sp. yr596]KOX59686.1 hypothetical protein ADL19_04405 [Streptomyces purpurogeneiscleroticus]SFF59920.1 hypothetical protein SAMN04487844_13050 [Methylobacterium sp. yr596]
MDYIDELRDGAAEHFKEWLAALAADDGYARAAAWGLRLQLEGLTPAEALMRVAEAMERHAGPHLVLYAASVAGGAYDDPDAIESMLETVEAILSDRRLSEAEREATRRSRIVARIRRGDYSDLDIEWLEIRAAAMTDAEILRMSPFDGEGIVELSRRVVTCSTAVRDHWTRRVIEPGERHLVLRESLMGRETETRHSELSAYLHVVCGDGGAAEFLDVYNEHLALAS